MNMLEYVHLYRPKAVDVWTIELVANDGKRGTWYSTYIYDVPSDRMEGPAGLPQQVRDAITRKPSRGYTSVNGQSWRWIGTPAIGKRDEDDLEFEPRDVTRINAFVLRVSIDGRTTEVRVAPRRGSYQVADPELEQPIGMVIDNIDRQLSHGGARHGSVGDVTWELTRIEWR